MAYLPDDEPFFVFKNCVENCIYNSTCMCSVNSDVYICIYSRVMSSEKAR